MTNLPGFSERGIFAAHVSSNRILCPEHFALTLRVDAFPAAEPGQFVQIAASGPDTGPANHSGVPFLRRPFSIAGLRRYADHVEIDLLGRVIGPGTHRFSLLRPDEQAEIIGPLGRSFPIAADMSAAILVAGGIGLPPLLWLAEVLQRRGVPTVAVVGATSVDRLPLRPTPDPDRSGRPTNCIEEFARVGVPVAVTTDDGSLGLRGRTTDALVEVLSALRESAQRPTVYTCGPEAMMRRVAEICAGSACRCWVCLERIMACGMGTCQSCVVRVRDASPRRWHYELCCTQGPVFDAARVAW